MNNSTLFLCLALVASVSAFNCTSDADCKNDGRCSTDPTYKYQECICQQGFIHDDCSYKQKNQLTAFVLSTGFGVLGVDRFWLGYTAMACCKLIFPSIFIAIGSIAEAFLRKNNGTDRDDMPTTMAKAVTVFGKFFAVLWWLIDLILIGTYKVTEYNGEKLWQQI